MLVEQPTPRGPNAESYAAECLIANPHCTVFVHKYDTAQAHHNGGKRRGSAAEYVYAKYK